MEMVSVTWFMFLLVNFGVFLGEFIGKPSTAVDGMVAGIVFRAINVGCFVYILSEALK